MRTVIAFGPDGGKVLESLVFAVLAGLGESMQMVWVEPDDSLDVLQSLLDAANALGASFTLRTIRINDGTAAALDEDKPLLQSVLDRQEAAAHWRSRAEKHPNLAALAFGVQPMDFDTEEKVVLCGAAWDSWNAAGLLYCTRKMDVSRVVLLPYQPVKPEAAAVAAETLRMLAEEEHPAATYMIGMPEGSRTEMPGVHLVHWLGALAAIADQEPGVYSTSVKEDGIRWPDFGEKARAIQQGYEGLLRASAAMLAEVVPTLQERLGARPKLGQRRAAWYQAYFRQAHKLDETALASLRAQVTAVELLCRRYVAWVMAIVASLPPQWQDREAFHAAEQQMAAHYRLLLEAAGELSLMEEEINRSGMAKEQLVRRGAPRETAADELLRKADEKRSVLSKLEKEQAELDRKAGGGAKKRLMKRMEQGIDRALEAEGARVTAWKASPEAQGAQALQLQESIYRLETHMRMLQAERARVERDQAEQTACPPAQLPQVRPWGNDLFSPELLGQLAKYMTTEDERERRQLAAELTAYDDTLQGLKGREDSMLLGLWQRLNTPDTEEVR